MILIIITAAMEADITEAVIMDTAGKYNEKDREHELCKNGTENKTVTCNC